MPSQVQENPRVSEWRSKVNPRWVRDGATVGSTSLTTGALSSSQRRLLGAGITVISCNTDGRSEQQVSTQPSASKFEMTYAATTGLFDWRILRSRTVRIRSHSQEVSAAKNRRAKLELPAVSSAYIHGSSLEDVPCSVELRGRSGEHQAALTSSLCTSGPIGWAISRSRAAWSDGRCR
jgi:hypothetical protein